ncbi:hypothetical protein ACFSKL_06925 [Belliella marina]|uniref:Uncharacterized protein n=1 Tax=Belliella marina TaxID=1644146 RepID=A0ABW4VK79_9BACT
MKELLKDLIGKEIYCLYSERIELNTSSEETQNHVVIQMTPYILIRLTKNNTFGVKLLSKQIDDDHYKIVVERYSIEELKHNDLNFSKHFIRPLEKIHSINVYIDKYSSGNSDLATSITSMIEICFKSSCLVLYPSYIPFGGMMSFYDPFICDKNYSLEDHKLAYSLK